MNQKIRFKIDQISFHIVGILIFSVLYSWACTNSLKDTVIESFKNQINILKIVIQYISIGLILLSLIIQKEIVYKFSQKLGLLILVSVLLVSILSFLPCKFDFASKRNFVEVMKRSLLCPSYSIRSWIHLYLFLMLGLINYGLPIFMRFKK
jgi:hypothetical protein